MLAVLRCLTENHDPRLVAVAAMICGLASFTASALLSRAAAAEGPQRLTWIAVAGVEFGGGIWSLHFVAMLAFMPGMPIGYDPATTAWSVAIAIGGSVGAFALAMRRRRGGAAVFAAAVMLVMAVGGMHYTGVAAMRMGGMVRLDPATVAASLAASLACSVAAVLAMRRLRRFRERMVVAALLSAAVCTLHFVGMSALILSGGGMGAVPPGMLGPRALSVVVAVPSASLVLVGLMLSIVDRLLHEQAGAEKDRLRKLTGISFEGLIIARDGIIVDVNERICAFSGYARPELLGRPVNAILGVAPGRRGAGTCWAAGNGDDLLRRSGGDTMPVEILRASIPFDRSQAMAIAVRDLTARRESEAALQRLAHHDALTGLANRVLLDLRLRQLFENGSRAERRGAVLCLDLDRFKPVNDLLGHAAGDRLLVAVAGRLSALLPPADTLARVGGDEFVVLMPEAGDIGACAALAERIVQGMRRPFELDDQQVVVGVSIGIALYPQDGRTADELLRCADIALYRSKEDGRGTYRLFEAKMDAELQTRRALERDLRSAIEAQELELFYQPLVSCEAGEIDGYEALLRWRHPARGLIPPAEFIPIAEESGLILPLGQWVLETACAAAAAWTRPRRVAVNLSPTQFRQTDLVEWIMEVLRRTNLPPDRLELEVTEGVLINEPERAVALLSRLRSRGVRVSLDDFGTGYSSLSYLRQFPLDKIKIDRSFISDLGRDQRSASIVRAVVVLAHSLGLSVTAEGVETEKQLGLLQRQLCNQVQGYLLGRPEPLHETGETVPPDPRGAAGNPVAAEATFA